jgi:hypothetical protein
MDIDTSLGELFASVEKYDGAEAFDRFKTETFFRYDRDMRTAVLMGWDKMMERETKPTRATAELISQKRELDDLHRLLSRAGR